MASKAQGGAEIYSTDVMLSLHEQGIDQCVVLPASSSRAKLLAKAGLRLATACLDFPFSRGSDCKSQARTARKTRYHSMLDAPRRRTGAGFAGPVIGWVRAIKIPQNSRAAPTSWPY